MIKIGNIKVPVREDRKEIIEKKISKLIKVSTDDIDSLRIIKESIDARDKKNVFKVYTVAFNVPGEEKKILKRFGGKDVSLYEPIEYKIIAGIRPDAACDRPVIIGGGPAGLFAALILSKAGLSPILLERGKAIEDRQRDVDAFFNDNILNPGSNVQFGEGGAGAFSDGKLNTLVNDRFGRSDFVLKTFVSHGADPSILYTNKPHVGTDVLFRVIPSIRKEIISLGGEFRFQSQVVDFLIENDHKGERRLKAVVLDNGEKIYGSDFLLAIGHSARDTFLRLHECLVPMKAKEFAVGFRIEHPQEWLGRHQYGDFYKDLPAASYKLSSSPKGEKGVYSFCMCPGGYVVNASSENEGIACNGMSYEARDSKNANSAIIVTVGNKEYDMDDPLSGIQYQRNLERNAYAIGCGGIPQQLLSDFCKCTASKEYRSVVSLHKGFASFGNLRPILGEEINAAFIRGLKDFDRKISGFFMDDAVLSGVESRTSSPVRIFRDDNFMSEIKGLYPCGEGAGYAGGIMSAAMDGMKCAEKIIENQLLNT